MNKKALIHVFSVQPDESDKEEPIEVVTPGSFYKKGDFYYAMYEETEISGMEGTTTTLKIGEDKFSLIRRGNITSKMEFEMDKKNISMYNTPYGTLQLSIDTKELDIEMGEEGGKISIDYDMTVEGQKPQNTSLSVHIEAQ